MRDYSEAQYGGEVRIAQEIPQPVKALLNDLRLVQAQIDALPGPKLHQDHDFAGERENLETLYGWFRETGWVPYWGGDMLLLGGRDPWIETLELRVWSVLHRLAEAAGCELIGRGAVAPDDNELEAIRVIFPQIAEANGWVFEGPGESVLQ